MGDKRRPVTPAEDQQIAMLYAAGLSTREVGTFLDRNQAVVRYRLRKMGIACRPAVKRQPNPIIAGRKNCQRCGAWRHMLDFIADPRGSDPSGAICRRCCRLANRRDLLDGETLTLRREYDRIWKHGRRQAAGASERRWGPQSRRGGGRASYLDVEPIAQRLDAFCERFVGDHHHQDGPTELERRSGISARRIHDYRTRTAKRITASSADKLALAMGLTLDLIYDREVIDEAMAA